VGPNDILGRPADAPLPDPAGLHGGELLREVKRAGPAQRQGLQDSDPFEPLVWRAVLAFELQVMEQMELPHLLPGGPGITCRYAASKASRWGPAWLGGRPLVALRLGITALDPVVLDGLLFERFPQPRSASRCRTSTPTSASSARSEVIAVCDGALWRRQGGPNHHLQPHCTSKAVLQAMWPRVARIPMAMPTASPSDSCGCAASRQAREMIGPRFTGGRIREKYEKRRWCSAGWNMARRIEGTNKTFGVSCRPGGDWREPLR